VTGSGIILPGDGSFPPSRRELRAVREEELRPLVEIGLFHTGTKFRYRCPVCRKIEANDQRLELVCTGPHPSLHEHPPEPMVSIP
jgi:hypothetical protein